MATRKNVTATATATVEEKAALKLLGIKKQIEEAKAEVEVKADVEAEEAKSKKASAKSKKASAKSSKKAEVEAKAENKEAPAKTVEKAEEAKSKKVQGKQKVLEDIDLGHRNFKEVSTNESMKTLFAGDIVVAITQGANTTCKLYDYLRDVLGWKKLPGSVKFREFCQSEGLAQFTIKNPNGKRTVTSVSLPE